MHTPYLMQLAETAHNSANQLKRPLQAQEGPGGTLNALLDVVLDSPPPLAQRQRLCVGRLLPSTTQQKAVGLRRLATPSPFFTPLLGGPALVKKGPMQRPCLALFVWVGARVRACAHARVRAAGCSESAQVRCGTTQGQGNVVKWMMLSTKAQVTKQMCTLILCQQQFSLFAVTFFFLRPLMRGSSVGQQGSSHTPGHGLGGRQGWLTRAMQRCLECVHPQSSLQRRDYGPGVNVVDVPSNIKLQPEPNSGDAENTVSREQGFVLKILFWK